METGVISPYGVITPFIAALGPSCRHPKRLLRSYVVRIGVKEVFHKENLRLLRRSIRGFLYTSEFLVP